MRWGSAILETTPPVLGNAMPKSGSHLITQVLQGLPRLGPFVNPGFPPVNRGEDNRKLNDQHVLENLHRMRPGDIGYGYLQSREPFVSLLAELNIASIFVYRDPRDMVVSHVFYATQMNPNHGMNRHYTQSLSTMEERINAAIEGVEVPGSELSPIHAKYDGYLGWLNKPEVLCLRFEEMILDRRNTLERLLLFMQSRGACIHLELSQAVEILQEKIAPQKSGTFRKGQPGNWREHFSPANKACFKQNAGDLLIQLGYEMDDNW